VKELVLSYLRDAEEDHLQFKGKPLTPEQKEIVIHTLGAILADEAFQQFEKDKS